MTSPLQSPQRTAYLPGQIRLHTQPNGNISFRHSIAVLTYRGKGQPDDSVIFGDFRDQIDVKVRGSIIEDDQDLFAVTMLADCTHQKSFSRAVQ